MLTVTLAVIFGSLIAIFATQNTNLVNITIAGNQSFAIPLYLVVAVSLLLGIFVSSLISILNSINSEITLKGKDNELKKALGNVDTLKRTNQELESEINRLHLKIRENEAKYYETLQNGKGPSIIDRIKHNLNAKRNFNQAG